MIQIFNLFDLYILEKSRALLNLKKTKTKQLIIILIIF